MRILQILLFVPLLLSMATLAAQNESSAIRSFKKDFRSSGKQATPTKERRAALKLLEGFDSKDVAQALVSAYRELEDELETLVTERDEVNERIRQILSGQENSTERRLPTGTLATHEELVKDSERLRRLIDARHELQAELRDRIGQIRSEDGLEWLVSDGLRDRKLPIQLKLQIAQAAGSASDRMVPQLVDALGRVKTPEATCAVLGGLGTAGKASNEASDDIIELLEDDDQVVREHAAWALSRIATPQAIEPMIALLERETGQARKRVAAALEILTGQQHGTQIASWKAWWNAEGAGYAAGDHELGKGKPSRRDEAERGYAYFGIPDDGKSTVYIIDASGSMAKEVDIGSGGTGSGRAQTSSRMELCKAELISTLGRLTPDDHFNVLWYNDQPHLFTDKMIRGTPKEVEAAQEWVRKLQPVSSTNIYDSLQMAFGLTGQGAKDKHYESAVDTIFLLTDGSPTLPNGEQDSTEKIIAAVREWNPLKKVTIHCIGIGGELNRPFLEQLAAENNGQFRER